MRGYLKNKRKQTNKSRKYPYTNTKVTFIQLLEKLIYLLTTFFTFISTQLLINLKLKS